MPQEPRRIQQYQILGPIGRGGMATVYLAFDEDLGRHVALKELNLGSRESALAERFMRESRMAASLAHANIVTVFARIEHEGVPYIAMEYLEFGSLRDRVSDLALPQVYGILEGTLAGLAHAHDQGLVHRDLKPENVLVTSGGAVKIADFGIAKAFTSTTQGLTGTGTTLGTPEYMAPEQAASKSVGPATDLYSLGIIAFELLCGRVPFEQTDDPLTVLFRHVNEPPPSPLSLHPGMEPRLGAWIERLLAKDPADRPQNAEQAWEELEDVVVSLHGPMWRREARLPPAPGGAHEDTPKPLTPAPFEDTPTDRQRLLHRRGLVDQPPAVAQQPQVPPPPVGTPLQSQPPSAVPATTPAPPFRAPPARIGRLASAGLIVALAGAGLMLVALLIRLIEDQPSWDWIIVEVAADTAVAAVASISLARRRPPPAVAFVALAAFAAAAGSWVLYPGSKPAWLWINTIGAAAVLGASALVLAARWRALVGAFGSSPFGRPLAIARFVVAGGVVLMTVLLGVFDAGSWIDAFDGAARYTPPVLAGTAAVLAAALFFRSSYAGAVALVALASFGLGFTASYFVGNTGFTTSAWPVLPLGFGALVAVALSMSRTRPTQPR